MQQGPRVAPSYEGRIATLAVTLSIGLALACGASNPNDIETSSAAISGETPTAHCPESPPDDGASCSGKNLECSWGDDDRFGCRTQAVCEDVEGALVWGVTTAACPEPAPKCPKTAPSETGDGGIGHAECPDKDVGATCVYDAVAFTCGSCSGTLCSGENVWSVTDLATGCPDTVPNFGDACGPDKLVCDYNVCANDVEVPWAYGIEVRCEGGQWQFYDDGVCL